MELGSFLISLSVSVALVYTAAIIQGEHYQGSHKRKPFASSFSFYHGHG
jgi:hypothetical protein